MTKKLVKVLTLPILSVPLSLSLMEASYFCLKLFLCISSGWKKLILIWDLKICFLWSDVSVLTNVRDPGTTSVEKLSSPSFQESCSGFVADRRESLALVVANLDLESENVLTDIEALLECAVPDSNPGCQVVEEWIVSETGLDLLASKVAPQKEVAF